MNTIFKISKCESFTKMLDLRFYLKCEEDKNCNFKIVTGAVCNVDICIFEQMTHTNITNSEVFCKANATSTLKFP